MIPVHFLLSVHFSFWRVPLPVSFSCVQGLGFISMPDSFFLWYPCLLSLSFPYWHFLFLLFFRLTVSFLLNFILPSQFHLSLVLNSVFTVQFQFWFLSFPPNAFEFYHLVIPSHNFHSPFVAASSKVSLTWYHKSVLFSFLVNSLVPVLATAVNSFPLSFRF